MNKYHVYWTETTQWDAYVDADSEEEAENKVFSTDAGEPGTTSDTSEIHVEIERV